LFAGITTDHSTTIIKIMRFYHALMLAVLGFSFAMTTTIFAQGSRFGAGADTVFSVKWGTGQTFGREQFPRNVLGLPDTSARPNVPASSSREVCSLGMGGEIIIGWKNAVLLNGMGADFTIFENPFIRFDEKVFAEPAKVAVSRDGVRFVEFPFDSLRLRGCAGVTPTNGNNSPFNPRISGGDSFDLAQIGMDSVRYIKITDISAMVLNNPQHPFYDPTISGFDLDAIVGLSLVVPQQTTSVTTSVSRENADEHSFRSTVVVDEHGISLASFPKARIGEVLSLELYSVFGACVVRSSGVADVSLSTVNFPKGAYFLLLRSNHHVESHTIFLR
jgi:hypothetical protein